MTGDAHHMPYKDIAALAGKTIDPLYQNSSHRSMVNKNLECNLAQPSTLVHPFIYYALHHTPPGHSPAVECLHVVGILSEGRSRVGNRISPLLAVEAGLGRVQEARQLRQRSHDGEAKAKRGDEGMWCVTAVVSSSREVQQ